MTSVMAQVTNYANQYYQQYYSQMAASQPSQSTLPPPPMQVTLDRTI